MNKAEYSKIIVRGDDAATFLQGQLTNDVMPLSAGEQQIAAWCNPKGRVIAILRVFKTDQGFELVLPAELADDVVARLTMYRFRAKVDLQVEAADAPASVEGLPFIGSQQTEKFTPHMLNLDLLDAIDFDKGCYTGQEVVARTHYRGATKRRALRFTAEAPLAVGDKVSADDRDVGEVLNVDGTELLAVVPVDSAEKALKVGSVALTPLPLPYL